MAHCPAGDGRPVQELYFRGWTRQGLNLPSRLPRLHSPRRVLAVPLPRLRQVSFSLKQRHWA